MLNKILSTHLLAAVGVLSISQVFAGEQDLPNLNALAKSHQILTAKENAASVDLEDKEQKLQKSRENLAKAQAALKALVNLKGKKGASLLTAFSSGGFEVKEAGVETKEKEVQVREAVNILSVLSIKNTGVYLSMFRSAQDVREVFAVLVERGMNLIAQGALERNQQKIVEGQKMIQQVAILEAKIPQEVQSKSDEQMLVGLNKLSIQVDQDIVQYKDLQTELGSVKDLLAKKTEELQNRMNKDQEIQAAVVSLSEALGFNSPTADLSLSPDELFSPHGINTMKTAVQNLQGYVKSQELQLQALKETAKQNERLAARNLELQQNLVNKMTAINGLTQQTVHMSNVISGYQNQGYLSKVFGRSPVISTNGESISADSNLSDLKEIK